MAISLHALLPLFLVLTAFGPGYQTISSLTILYFPLSVYYTRTITRLWWITLFYMMNSIGFMLAYMKTPGDKIRESFVYGLAPNLIMLIPYLFDRIAQRKFSSNGWARIMVFPCVWTGIWTIMLYLWVLGDWGNYAFSLLNYGEILQLASFAGLGGINFILSWSGTIGSDIISHYVVKKPNSFTTPILNTGPITIASTENNSTDTDTVPRTPLTNPQKKILTLLTFINSLSIYLFMLFLVISYGSIRLNTNFVPFYQQDIKDSYAKGLTNFGCVTVNTHDTFDSYINATRELAISKNKIILWSEAILTIRTTEDLNLLLDLIKNISITYETYIGFTYIESITEKSFSKQVVINNKGDIVIDYKKSNLSPITDEYLTKGDNTLQTFQSEEFGYIGSAICLDFNFPKFIGQASSKNINLMLNSGNTWVSPVGPLQARMNAIRSIENGFTTFRCSSHGISGVWNQYGQPLHYIPTVNTPTVTFQVPIATINNRVKTGYSIFGETFGWICVGNIGVFLIAMVLVEKGNDKWKARIHYWL